VGEPAKRPKVVFSSTLQELFVWTDTHPRGAVSPRKSGAPEQLSLNSRSPSTAGASRSVPVDHTADA
jgi:hypothetical protein